MSSVDSYRMRPSEELTEHLADINTQCENAWKLYESLCAQRLLVLGVIAEAVGSQAVGHEARVETIEPAPPILSIVAA